jgi:hypothetical protein
VCGFYDATVKAVDPFPDRDTHQAPDPTLFAIERVFAGAINTQIRQNLKLESDRDYRLLSMDVNSSWTVDTRQHAFELQVGATDDLRYAMALNPYMKVFITHGLYDIVTPYFSSDRLIDHMKLTIIRAGTCSTPGRPHASPSRTRSGRSTPAPCRRGMPVCGNRSVRQISDAGTARRPSGRLARWASAAEPDWT